MYFEGVLVGVFTLICMVGLAFLFTLTKLAIFRSFTFIFTKSIWIEYVIFHLVMIVLTVASFFVFDAMDLSTRITHVIAPMFAVFAIFDFFWFHRRHFSFESKKKFAFAVILADLANFAIADLLFYVYLSLLMFLGFALQM